MSDSAPTNPIAKGSGNGRGKMGREALWQLLFAVSLTANVTGIGTWLTFGSQTITQEDLDRALARAPYPWIQDRGIVMGHLDNGTIHETDKDKRSRVRQEMEPLKNELGFVREDLRELRAEMKALTNEVRKKMP